MGVKNVELLVAIIENSEDINPILDSFFEEDIPGATVIDSRGMGHMIADHTSIFSRFTDLTGGEGTSKHNNVLFTVIEEEEKLNRAKEIIKSIVGDLDEPDTGLIFTLPVSSIEGFGTHLTD